MPKIKELLRSISFGKLTEYHNFSHFSSFQILVHFFLTLWKPGEDQVSGQMKGNAMTLMAFVHLCSRRGGISI